MHKHWRITSVIFSFIAVACLFVGYLFWVQKDWSMMLSCHSELFDRNASKEIDSRHTLVADITIKGKKAQVNYRYFNLDGSSAGKIIMQARVDDVSEDQLQYRLLITDKRVVSSAHGSNPAHLQYLAYVNELSMNDDNLAALNFEVLDYDKTKDYAVVLFHPSNTVCGCQLVKV